MALKNFVEELKWRGMLQDSTPDVEQKLMEASTSAYVGFDPTADSLHVGNLVPIMLLKHFQRCGHKPIALVGGATGMVGDPSGKSAERNLLSMDIIHKNQEAIKVQLQKFLSFEGDNAAEMVNNHDWFGNMGFLDFIRDTGKHISVNYMMAKDSVKKRLETGLSFTEFTYQLVQGYDFLHLYKNKNCTLQIGGSDQWGNITTGTELVRRVVGGDAHAITCPLMTKADGAKFGKSEGGNIWLDANKTSPYKFYQFWLNVADEDCEKLLKTFTFLDKESIATLMVKHLETPHLRLAQQTLADEITAMVHSDEDVMLAKATSQIIFGKSDKSDLEKLPVDKVKTVFEGIPSAVINRADLLGQNIVEVLSDVSAFLKSKSEARRALKENAISVNREKVNDAMTFDESHLISGAFALLQKGRKNFFLLVVE